MAELNGKKLPVWIWILVLGAAVWLLVWSRTVVVAVHGSFPQGLASEFKRLALTSSDLRWVRLSWIETSTGRCDFYLSGDDPENVTPLSSEERTGVWTPLATPDLGKWRAEFAHASGRFFALGATPWVWRVSEEAERDLRKMKPRPKKWSDYQSLSLAGMEIERKPWAAARSEKGIVMPADVRSMQQLWLVPCREGNPRGANQVFAEWAYSLEAQKEVVHAGYYSPWSKSPDPKDAVPYLELVKVPLLGAAKDAR